MVSSRLVVTLGCVVLNFAFGNQSFSQEVPSVALAPSPQRGVWKPFETFQQWHLWCSRVYYCYPTEPILHGTDQLVEGDTAIVTGTCSGYNSCDACETTPPQSCSWKLVKSENAGEVFHERMKSRQKEGMAIIREEYDKEMRTLREGNAAETKSVVNTYLRPGKPNDPRGCKYPPAKPGALELEPLEAAGRSINEPFYQFNAFP